MLSRASLLAVTLVFAHFNPKQMPEYFDPPAPGLAKEYDYVIGKSCSLHPLTNLSAHLSYTLRRWRSGVYVPAEHKESRVTAVCEPFQRLPAGRKMPSVFNAEKLACPSDWFPVLTSRKKIVCEYLDSAKLVCHSSDATCLYAADEQFSQCSSTTSLDALACITQWWYTNVCRYTMLTQIETDRGLTASRRNLLASQRCLMYSQVQSAVHQKTLTARQDSTDGFFNREGTSHRRLQAGHLDVAAFLLLMARTHGGGRNMADRLVPHACKHLFRARSLVEATLAGHGRTGYALASSLKASPHGTSLWTIPGSTEAVAFVKTKYADQSIDYPDVEIMLLSTPPTSEFTESFLVGMGLKQE
ncbi:unnamed protein product, partial [Ixodes hexagonus]